MRLAVPLRIAMREMRGGLRDFPVLLICLALGVAAIAGVGSIRAAIQTGLTSEAARLLGGDAQMQFTYRFASEEERAWMNAEALKVSELADFRSMASIGSGGASERALTQVKAVDGAYPLFGEVTLDPPMPLSKALANDGLPGVVAEAALLDRLGLGVGDQLTLGTQAFEIRAVLLRQPDNGGSGFTFGPRSLVRLDALEGSGLLAPGTLFDSIYRMRLPAETDLEATRDTAETLFADNGMRWRDRRNASPGTQRFVERMGSFLVLVGLAGLIVGGIGVTAAVRSYLERKTATIATLKTLGASGADVLTIYFIQIGILAAIGIAVGLLIGAIVPLVVGRMLAADLPVPAVFSIYPRPLAEAAFYGALTAVVFSLWPLARAKDTRAAGLFRDASTTDRQWPQPIWIVVIAGLVALLVGVSALLSGIPVLTLWVSAGVAASFALLLAAAYGVYRLARRLARAHLFRGRPATHLAFRAIGAPGNDTSAVMLSMGLGLTVLAAISQIDANMQERIRAELPEIAPSYFMVDIQNAQLDGFLDLTGSDAAVSEIETAPMLRGVLTRINGEPAREVVGPHWVLRGDRGVSYSDVLPDAAELTQGAWWPEDYSGPPLVSFAAEEAEEMGLTIGDKLTLNILGRDIVAQIHNLRVVDFSNMGINFIMIVNKAALAGAPHSHIATVYADEGADARLVRALATSYPNITAIRVRDAIDRVSEALGALAIAIRWAALPTLLTGFVVLIGAAAAGETRRTYEAAVLKTLGATRGRILASFALRATLLGFAAGLIALIAGSIAAWAVITLVMDAEFALEPLSALAIVIGGALANLLAGLAFAWRSLGVSAARVLRSMD